MAMFIVKPWYRKAVNPDDYFDPITHIATEENFIKFLECGVYDSKYIGYKVQLGNSVDYNNGLWVIADVNHDSANTGQTDCYDLISEDCFTAAGFSNSTNVWRNSDVRTWLNGTFYNGMSSPFRGHLILMKYNSAGSWYSDDNILLLSGTEINANTGVTEGVAYPIFTDAASRVVKIYNTAQTGYYWTRTKGSLNYVWNIDTDGLIYNQHYNKDALYRRTVMRVH